MNLPRRNQGLTLIELVITLALMGLVAGLASASWTSLISANYHTAMIHETQRMFALARSYSVNRKTLTTICPLSTEMKCTDNWNNPVSIFPDADNNKRPDNSRIYQVLSLTKGRSSLSSRTAGRGYFQLEPNGMSHGTMGSLVACSPGEDNSVEMTYMALNIGGRLRILRDNDKDGVIKLPWGTTITCPTT